MGGRLFGLIENAMMCSLLLIALAFFTRRTEWVPMLVNVFVIMGMISYLSSPRR